MKKGFTIIEIILSITLILVIGIGGIVIYRNNVKEKTLENMKEEIYRAVNVLVEIDSVTKKQLYESKNGAIIPLKKLESEGLIDFNGLNIEDEYVLSMLGNSEESEKCSGTLYNIGSWTKSNDDVIYICGGNTSSKDDYPDVLKDAIIYNAKKAEGYTMQTMLDVNNSLNFENRLVKNDAEYKFRGNVIDNYLNFNGMCWRIISILEDGSIKLLLQDKIDVCNGVNYKNEWYIGEGHYGYTYDYVTDTKGNKTSNKHYLANFLNSEDKENSMYYIMENWFNENFSNETQLKLKKSSWNITDTSALGVTKYVSNDSCGKFVHDEGAPNDLVVAGENLFKYSKTKKYDSYISTISSNEFENYMATDKLWLTKTVGLHYGSFDAYDVVFASGVSKGLYIYGSNWTCYLTWEGREVHASNYIRPVIVLNAGIKISGGSGTQAKPYVVA